MNGPETTLRCAMRLKRPGPRCLWTSIVDSAGLDADPGVPAVDDDVLRLMTIRSDDQFNTTIYSLDDRFRGIYSMRNVVLMRLLDTRRLGLNEGDTVALTTAADDGELRQVVGLRVTHYDIPVGCAAGYYPGCNPLLPLAHYAEESKVPAAKSIPVRLRKAV